MKNLYRIGLFIASAAAICLCYHYVSLIKLPFFSGSDLSNTELQTPSPLLTLIADWDGEMDTGMPGDASVTASAEAGDEASSEKPADVQALRARDTLTGATEYIVREYDLSSKKEESRLDTIPEQLIGKTRTQVENLVESYNNSPPLAELDRGFVSMEIASFSPQKLVMLKKYDSGNVSEHFYLIAEDNLITVYCSDLTTVYLYTDISMDALSDELRQEILDKKYIDSEEELYNFLESYSS